MFTYAFNMFSPTNVEERFHHSAVQGIAVPCCGPHVGSLVGPRFGHPTGRYRLCFSWDLLCLLMSGPMKLGTDVANCA